MTSMAGHVARMGNERGVRRILEGKPEGKLSVSRPRMALPPREVRCMNFIPREHIALKTITRAANNPVVTCGREKFIEVWEKLQYLRLLNPNQTKKFLYYIPLFEGNANNPKRIRQKEVLCLITNEI
ncbi:hypothetical protein C0J52_09449 [Blattella germanica]|nr:hypothetical protein C0J52_09449 [Blattella germanica]